jgi:hypothetical protein
MKMADAKAKTIIGGGDTVAVAHSLHLLNRFDFVSLGGGAMLEYLSSGTLPGIHAVTESKRPVIGSVGENTEDLRSLILKAKKGDTEAFGVVYRTLYTPLYRYVFSRCRDKELTNDVCQQAFLRFFQALPGYEPNKSPLAYLFHYCKAPPYQPRRKETPFLLMRPSLKPRKTHLLMS